MLEFFAERLAVLFSSLIICLWCLYLNMLVVSREPFSFVLVAIGFLPTICVFSDCLQDVPYLTLQWFCWALSGRHFVFGVHCGGRVFQVLNLQAFPFLVHSCFPHRVPFPIVMQSLNSHFSILPFLVCCCYSMLFIWVYWLLGLFYLFFRWWKKGDTCCLLSRCSFNKCFVQG